ncbi:MAG: 4'-phosphopantetheinyl transferase superfamily protein [Chitinophagaceae bacterium]|nr:MAG: 4'-phosphopantetheinyl transferase superfamily protein [Chitinophagaceae bacterium]
MPLFYQHEIDSETRLAVWRITESEAFFDVPLQREITHPHKRLQHLAGRYLLRLLFPDFPLALIRIADTRKPFLENEDFHFSISHCAEYAAAIVSRRRRVGIDVELPSEKVLRIRHKFLSAEEDARLAGLDNPIGAQTAATLIWSVKEAGFKWYGLGSVDFREDMPLQRAEREGEAYRFGLLFGKGINRELEVRCRLLDGLCLAYVSE